MTGRINVALMQLTGFSMKSDILQDAQLKNSIIAATFSRSVYLELEGIFSRFLKGGDL